MFDYDLVGVMLLESKLRIPAGRRTLVQRSRLLTALEQSVPNYRLILLYAPAGYGKTTLLAEWARTSSLEVAWLSLSEEDNEVEGFLRYLLKAWEKIKPDIVDAPPGILLASNRPEIKEVLAALLNAASQASAPLIFVLDNYDSINDREVHEALTYLIDNLPEPLHFVLTSRSDPLLPLARYRARGQLMEIRAEDLRFTRQEAVEFLQDTMGLELSPDEVTLLLERTEGWVAGLQLAALALQMGRNAVEETPLVSGRQRFIADYLREDVLNRLPSEVRIFLLKTSILDHLRGELCDALTGEQNGQAMLEALERENLFVIPLDDRREQFRYHSLFSDFLQAELQQRLPHEVDRLHQRASLWYLEHDLPEQAFRHAAAGEDTELVTQIFERYLVAKLVGGEIRLVKGWLDSLPQSWLTRYPMVVLARAGILLATGRFEECARCLDEVAQLPFASKEEADLHLGRATALRCNIACFQNDLARAEAFAAKALQVLPADELDFRAGIYGALGDTYRRNGRWAQALDSYRKLLEFTHAPIFQVEAVNVYGALADLELRQGHLQTAAEFWGKALQAIQQRENWGRFPLPLIGWVYIRLAELAYEWNDLVEASEHLSLGLERAELGGDVRAMIAGYLIATRLKLAEGDLEQAAAYLRQARPHIERTQFPYWSGRFERAQLELWLAQDNLHEAVRWADAKLKEATSQKQPESEAIQLTVARALVFKRDSDSSERALALLGRLLPAVEEEGRMGVQIEALALQAVAYRMRGKQARSLTALERALRLAEPEGYLRLFVDLGLPMGRLLQEAHSRNVMPRYVKRLLAAFDVAPHQEQQALPEALTEREIEVLELMAAGLTNREIAEALFISPETVKKHAGNIYGKLGVTNRTHAVARARELNQLK